MDRLVARIAQSLSQAQTLEQITPPLLGLLGEVSGLESTYLTQIDEVNAVQHVRFARNCATLTIPEGLSVPWGDTLCKRALDEGVWYEDDVPRRWGDSKAASALGIRTYASLPVRTSDGQVYGTLCAASAVSRPLSADAMSVFRMFAMVIAQFVERDRLLQDLQQRNAQLSDMALSDGLTGLPNRRALFEHLERLLAHARRTQLQVLVAFVDLDDFKGINDRHGHAAGDRFLQEMARRLKHCVRAGDLIARLGGDEFVVAGEGPPVGANADQAIARMQRRLQGCTAGRIELEGLVLDYAGASVGVVSLDPGHFDADLALREADHAMYCSKQLRRTAAGG